MALVELLKDGQPHTQPQVLGRLRPRIPPEFCIRQNAVDNKGASGRSLEDRAEAGLVRLISYANKDLKYMGYATILNSNRGRTDWSIQATPLGLEVFASAGWNAYAYDDSIEVQPRLSPRPPGLRKTYKQRKQSRLTADSHGIHFTHELWERIGRAAKVRGMARAEWVRRCCDEACHRELDRLTPRPEEGMTSDHEQPTESECGNVVLPMQPPGSAENPPVCEI